MLFILRRIFMSVELQREHQMAQFVANHAGKVGLTSYALFLTPPFGYLAAIGVAIATRGRVSQPMNWLHKQEETQRLSKLMNRSACVLLGSFAALEVAEWVLAKPPRKKS
jgi:hypothetical protein